MGEIVGVGRGLEGARVGVGLATGGVGVGLAAGGDGVAVGVGVRAGTRGVAIGVDVGAIGVTGDDVGMAGGSVGLSASGVVWLCVGNAMAGVSSGPRVVGRPMPVSTRPTARRAATASATSRPPVSSGVRRRRRGLSIPVLTSLEPGRSG